MEEDKRGRAVVGEGGGRSKASPKAARVRGRTRPRICPFRLKSHRRRDDIYPPREESSECSVFLAAPVGTAKADADASTSEQLAAARRPGVLGPATPTTRLNSPELPIDNDENRSIKGILVGGGLVSLVVVYLRLREAESTPSGNFRRSKQMCFLVVLDPRPPQELQELSTRQPAGPGS